jgi:hypothetical protein
MFIDNIDHAWRALFLRKHEPQESVSMAKYIWSTFFSFEAQWEVSLNTNERSRLEKIITNASCDVDLEGNLFDRAYDHVVRDMSRSLANFQTTEMWKTYCLNKTVIEALYIKKRSGATLRRAAAARGGGGGAGGGVEGRIRSESMGRDGSTSGEDSARGRSVSFGGDEDGSSESLDYDNVTRAEVMARVRSLYRTTQQVRLQKVPNKDFYHCLVGDQIRGRAKVEGETFYFMDMEEKLLLNVPYQVLFDKESVEISKLQRKGLQRRISMPTQLSSRLQAEVDGKHVRIAEGEKANKTAEPQQQKGLSRRTSGGLGRKNSVSKALKRQNSKSKLTDKNELSRNSSGKLAINLDTVVEKDRTSGLRRGSSAAQLKKDGRRRASTGVSPGNHAMEDIHFKNAEGVVLGPMSVGDAKMMWKYHLLEPKTEMSFDAGMNWQLVTESEIFVRSNQIQSIDPTVIVGKF